MIGASSKVVYVWEPFNLKHNAGLLRPVFQHMFTYVTPENESLYLGDVQTLLGSELKNGDKEVWKTLGHAAESPQPNQPRSASDKRRVLLKDPIAFFSAPWLVERFGADVVVMIRHPAAIAGSFKVKNWHFPFASFLDQPLLMRDYLAPYEEDIRRFAGRENEIVDEAVLLWKCIYGTLPEFQRRFPNWIYMRHEDLSLDPIGKFRNIFTRLKLPFSKDVAAVISEHSASSNPVDNSKGGKAIRRHSAANVMNWKNRLTEVEVTRLRTGLEGYWQRYYSDSDWEDF